jgi:hypothetical protein
LGKIQAAKVALEYSPVRGGMTKRRRNKNGSMVLAKSITIKEISP